MFTKYFPYHAVTGTDGGSKFGTELAPEKGGQISPYPLYFHEREVNKPAQQTCLCTCCSATTKSLNHRLVELLCSLSMLAFSIRSVYVACTADLFK